MSLKFVGYVRWRKLFNYRHNDIYSRNFRMISSIKNVTIGEISKEIDDPKKVEYVPKEYLIYKDGEVDLSQNHLHHLRWMLQKDKLGQDMFLLGPPGPNRRQIAMKFLELTEREVEYVALSRDTTEADLKQRREIQGSTAKYFDQSAVRAATEGRILILEGIEKAERNVLPVLNNLLENREMHLEDGRFLIPANRYDKLLQEHGEEKMKSWRLEKVQDTFRIIALGLPVPRYPGNALDPPLRSRFQARHISPQSYQDLMAVVSSVLKENTTRGEQLVAVASTIAGFTLPSDEKAAQVPLKLHSLNLPDFPLDSIEAAANILKNNPYLSAHDVLCMFYPYESLLPKESIKNLARIFNAFKINHEDNNINDISIGNIKKLNAENEQSVPLAEVSLNVNKEKLHINVPCGALLQGQGISNDARGFVENNYHKNVLCDLMQAHAVSDICIIGPKGCGKSRVAEELGRLLGYNVETMTLYRDMSARELLQQRETTSDGGGDTGWRPSPIVSAALKGRLLLLDGLHRLHSSTLSVLHRLIQDRELQLYDGTRLLRSDRYDKLIQSGFTSEDLLKAGIYRIHPAFRIIALAEPPSLFQGNHWLTPEVLTLFSFHQMRNFTKEEEIYIISQLFNSVSDSLKSIINLAHLLRTSNDSTLKNLSTSLSTRQLLRIADRMTKYPSTSAYDMIQHAFMAKFLPNIARNALENACNSCSISPDEKMRFFGRKNTSENINYKVDNGILTIGSTSVPVYKTESLTKVPDILFYDVPQHIKLLEWLLQDFSMGNHLLLVGNQGVGKNKIADRLLQLLNRPREYIQLHRDTTVHSLTVQPTVKDGMVLYEDSPLVKAVKDGHVLVVDEADKAPTHVTCILKSLVENGEMTLSDGRRIVPKHLIKNFDSSEESLIVLHEDFKMIVLANRPGFPFLGNDFFAALGDLFSCHAVDNPSIESELQLLQQYGPDVPIEIMKKIVNAFSTLRTMADQGVVTYPYSTREVVNIIKHLQEYPSDDLGNAISNVFDFDQYTSEVTETLLEVLKSSGLPTKGVLYQKKVQKPVQITIKRKSGLDVSGPKHGKVDPKGDPHVGGNTWAGGTGGRDTAGLGGKGGPYRLDAGHPVHQLSDEEKNDIPEHIKKAAREMNRRAFEERLKEIRMSEYDAKLYGQYFNAVQTQVGALRGILSALQARATERHWARHQTSGDFDDTKIIEGLTGEQGIYKRRTEQTPMPGTPLNRPKRLRLLTDVSGSMYRFNSFDGRLERSLEAVVLVMEALKGFESQIRYDIWGHSGETHDLEIVPLQHPPQNEKERLKVIRNMHAHSQFCWAGDNTVPAVELAVKQMATEIGTADNSQWDEALLVVLSDANLSRYGVPASRLGAALTSHNSIRAHVIFIGSLGDQAESLLKQLPMGRAFICMDVSRLPQILQQIFASSVSDRTNDS